MGNPVQPFNPLNEAIDRMLLTCVAVRPLYLRQTVCAATNCNALGNREHSCLECSTIYCSSEHKLKDEENHNSPNSPFYEYHECDRSMYQGDNARLTSNLEDMMYIALGFHTKEFLEAALNHCSFIISATNISQTYDRFLRATYPALLLRLGKYEQCFTFLVNYGLNPDKSKFISMQLSYYQTERWNMYDELPSAMELPHIMRVPLMLIKIWLYYTLSLIEDSSRYVGIDPDAIVDAHYQISSFMAPAIAPETLKFRPELIKNGGERRIEMHQLKLQIASLYHQINGQYINFWNDLIYLVDHQPIRIEPNEDLSNDSEYQHAVSMYAIVWAETPFAMVMTRTLYDYQRNKEIERVWAQRKEEAEEEEYVPKKKRKM